MGCIFHQKLSISQSQLWLQSRMLVLIVSCHDPYVHCAVLAVRSSPADRFPLREILCELQSKIKQISRNISCSFTAIQHILVWLQIWTRKVEEHLKLHNLHTDHFLIHWDLRYFIGVNVAETVKLTRSPGTTQPQMRHFWPSPGNNPTKINAVGFLAGSETLLSSCGRPNPSCWQVTRTCC